MGNFLIVKIFRTGKLENKNKKLVLGIKSINYRGKD